MSWQKHKNKKNLLNCCCPAAAVRNEWSFLSSPSWKKHFGSSTLTADSFYNASIFILLVFPEAFESDWTDQTGSSAFMSSYTFFCFASQWMRDPKSEKKTKQDANLWAFLLPLTAERLWTIVVFSVCGQWRSDLSTPELLCRSWRCRRTSNTKSPERALERDWFPRPVSDWTSWFWVLTRLQVIHLSIWSGSRWPGLRCRPPGALVCLSVTAQGPNLAQTDELEWF